MDGRSKIAISEGSAVYGNGGRYGGRIAAVGAKYVTIAAGLFGPKTFHLPLSLIAHADDQRVELPLPLIEAQAWAYKDSPPPDEPIDRASRPVRRRGAGVVGIPVERREDFGPRT